MNLRAHLLQRRRVTGSGDAAYTDRIPGPAEEDPVGHRRRNRRQEVVLAIAVPALFLVAWQVAATNEWINERFFPAPSTIGSTGWNMSASGELHRSVLDSVERVLIGLGLGSAFGFAIGTLMGTSRLIRAALDPLLSSLYTVPKLALLPLFLVIFGLGEAPQIALITVTVFFFMWISTMSALLNVDPRLLEPLQTMNASWLQRFRHVLLPASLPEVFVGLRLSAGVAILVMVAAEFVQGDSGIGHIIWFSWSLFRTDRMYVGIVTVALLGLVFTQAVKLAARLVIPWAATGERGATVKY